MSQKGFLASLKESIANLFVTKNKEKNIEIDRVKEFYKSLMSKENILKPIDEHKNTFAHNAKYVEWKEIYDIYKDDPDMLVKIFTAENDVGDFPIHEVLDRGLDSDVLKEYFDIMNRALKDNPDVLIKIHTTKKKGSLYLPLDYKKSCDRKFLYKLYERTGDETLLEKLIFQDYDRTRISELDSNIALKYLENKPDMLLRYLRAETGDCLGNITFTYISDKNLVAITNKLNKEGRNPYELYKLYMTKRTRKELSRYGPPVYKETVTPKDKKFAKIFLNNIIDLVQHTNLDPDRSEKLLWVYYDDANRCGLAKEFDNLIKYCQRVQKLPNESKYSLLNTPLAKIRSNPCD